MVMNCEFVAVIFITQSARFYRSSNSSSRPSLYLTSLIRPYKQNKPSKNLTVGHEQTYPPLCKSHVFLSFSLQGKWEILTKGNIVLFQRRMPLVTDLRSILRVFVRAIQIQLDFVGVGRTLSQCLSHF